MPELDSDPWPGKGIQVLGQADSEGTPFLRLDDRDIRVRVPAAGPFKLISSLAALKQSQARISRRPGWQNAIWNRELHYRNRVFSSYRF